MASVLVDRPIASGLNHFFGDISSKYSSVEAAEVVKSFKRIYGVQFEGLQNEDLLSCLKLLFKSIRRNRCREETTISPRSQEN